MEKEHKPKKHRFRKAYTVHVISDNPDSAGHRYHFSAGMSQFLIIGGFLLAMLTVCYIIYSAMSLHTLRRLQHEQTTLTQQLQSQNAQLSATNNALQNEVSQLSRAINQKIEAEQAAEEEAHAMTLPMGFPLSGAATIAEGTAEDDAEETAPIMQFNGIEIGSSVIATGAGTVIEVSNDATYGYRVVLSHNDGYESVYLNGGVPIVDVGDEVVFAQDLFRIGQGNTHLGYQVRKDGSFINPEELLEING